MKLVTASAISLVAAGVVAFASQSPPPVLREFSEAIILDQANEPSAGAAIGDLDGDGDLDIVLAKGRHWGAKDRVLLNDGAGHFTAKDLSDRDDASYSTLLSDIDRDGDLDIVVSNDHQAKVVYTNDGKANFTLAGEWGVPRWPTRAATMADLNGDGWPDIIAANRSPETGTRSAFCLNDQHGRFPSCTELSVGPASVIAAVDLDRDGHIDLIAPFRDGGQSLILYNDGKAGFARTTPFGSATAAAGCIAGDLNGDGWPDVILTDQNVGAFVFLNDGKGGLLPGLQLKFDQLGPPHNLVIGDLNRDGHADIVIGYAGSRGSVLFGDGTGRSYRNVHFGDDQGAVYGLALGDLDGDGYPDIVAARSGAPDQLFFNRPGPGADIVVASDNIASPDSSMALFSPQPPVTWNPIVGVWRGIASDGPPHPYYTGVELRVEQSDSGDLSGTTLLTSNGVGYCRFPMMFKERKPDGTLAFTVTENRCVRLPIEVKLLDKDHVQWTEHLSPDYGITGTLERKSLTPNPAKGDLDGDGRPDCPSDARTGHNACLTITKPYDGFATRAVADFDRDGHVDFASPVIGLTVFGDGRGGVARTAPGPKNDSAHVAVAADLNGDGWPDLILADVYSGVFVYVNDRHGRFQVGRQFARMKANGAYAMTEVPTTIAAGDLNGDGKLDLVMVGEKETVVLLNDGTGAGFVEIKAGEFAAHGIELKDLDGDGSPDIAMSNGATNGTAAPGRAGVPPVNIVVTDRVRNSIPYLDPIALDPKTPMVGVWRGNVVESGGSTYPVEVQIDRLDQGQPAGRMIYGYTNVYYCGSPLVLTEVKGDAYAFEGSFNVGWGCNWQNRIELRMLKDGRLQFTVVGGKFRKSQITTLERKVRSR